jgi:hypothetical protein
MNQKVNNWVGFSMVILNLGVLFGILELIRGIGIKNQQKKNNQKEESPKKRD